MSDELNNKSIDEMSEDEVLRYRQRRVNEFHLSISDDEDSTPASRRRAHPAAQNSEQDSHASNEITSFSDETTKAQIEKESIKTLKLQRKEEKKILKIKSGRNKKIYRITWLAMILIVSIVVSQYFIVGSNDFLAINRTNEETVNIKIGKDESIDSIAKNLQSKGVIDSAEFFVLFAKFTGKGNQIDPGVYEIGKNKDYLGIINYLQNTDNRKTTITLQVTEGTNILELSKQLYDAGITTDTDKFLELCNSDEFDAAFTFLADIKPDSDREYKLEGYMFPDTYEFYVDEAPDITIRRFLANFEDKINKNTFKVSGYSEVMTVEQLIKRSDYSLDEIVKIASIVQGEASDTEDMYKVSSVIHNRIENGAQYDIHTLGMDSTSFYPYKNADAVPEDIKDTFKSKYETYDSEGLPPGAICSMGVDALLAAVAPEKTDYLYFCHGTNDDGTVTTYYASTYSEHQNNLYKAGLSE